MGKSNSYYMQLHVEALFTMNEKNELMTIREPWDSTSQPAPRFYLTRPLYEKPHAYFRADVPKKLREKLQSITNREPVLMLPNESPIYDKESRMPSHITSLNPDKRNDDHYLVKLEGLPPDFIRRGDYVMQFLRMAKSTECAPLREFVTEMPQGEWYIYRHTTTFPIFNVVSV